MSPSTVVTMTKPEFVMTLAPVPMLTDPVDVNLISPSPEDSAVVLIVTPLATTTVSEVTVRFPVLPTTAFPNVRLEFRLTASVPLSPLIVRAAR
jgi:hypothetical protein